MTPRRWAIWAAALSLAVSAMLLSPASAQAAAKVPSIGSIAPTKGYTSGGTKVTITGKNFTKSSIVHFGSAKATKVTYSSTTRLYAYSPKVSSAQTVAITAKTSAGTSAKTTKAQFTYSLKTNLGTDTLNLGGSLQQTQYLRSKSDKYRLIMQTDGNLVLYQVTPWKAVWSIGKHTGKAAALQTDGNLVVRDPAGRPVWAANTDGFTAATLIVQDDGNLVIYNKGVAIWDRFSGYLANRWRAGVTLAAGSYLKSANRRLTLVMQNDGNLVLYDSGKAKWASGTAGSNYAVMQTDGNMVVYRKEGGALAASNTDSFDGATMALQDDGNAVIYYASLPIWSNGVYLGDRLSPGQTMNAGDLRRSTNKRYTLAMQGDGNLVLYNGGSALWATGTSGDNRAIMQGDGNLVVYRNGGGALWDSKTAGKDGSFLVVQNDANLVIYQGATAVWARNGVGTLRGDDYPSNLKNAAKDAVVDPWLFYNRECTSFVAWRLNSANGAPFSNYMVGPNGRKGHFGNADNWGANAQYIGYTVNRTPAVGSVAWWSSQHVAWVAKVNGDGTIVIEEYNRNYDGKYSYRTIPAGSPTGYIHIKDL